MELQHSTCILAYFLFLCQASIPCQTFSGLPDLNLLRKTVSKNKALLQLCYASKFWKFELNLLQSEADIFHASSQAR